MNQYLVGLSIRYFDKMRMNFVELKDIWKGLAIRKLIASV